VVGEHRLSARAEHAPVRLRHELQRLRAKPHGDQRAQPEGEVEADRDLVVEVEEEAFEVSLAEPFAVEGLRRRGLAREDLEHLPERDELGDGVRVVEAQQEALVLAHEAQEGLDRLREQEGLRDGDVETEAREEHLARTERTLVDAQLQGGGRAQGQLPRQDEGRQDEVRPPGREASRVSLGEMLGDAPEPFAAAEVPEDVLEDEGVGRVEIGGLGGASPPRGEEKPLEVQEGQHRLVAAQKGRGDRRAQEGEERLPLGIFDVGQVAQRLCRLHPPEKPSPQHQGHHVAHAGSPRVVEAQLGKAFEGGVQSLGESPHRRVVGAPLHGELDLLEVGVCPRGEQPVVPLGIVEPLGDALRLGQTLHGPGHEVVVRRPCLLREEVERGGRVGAGGVERGGGPRRGGGGEIEAGHLRALRGIGQARQRGVEVVGQLVDVLLGPVGVHRLDRHRQPPVQGRQLLRVQVAADRLHHARVGYAVERLSSRQGCDHTVAGEGRQRCVECVGGKTAGGGEDVRRDRPLGHRQQLHQPARGGVEERRASTKDGGDARRNGDLADAAPGRPRAVLEGDDADLEERAHDLLDEEGAAAGLFPHARNKGLGQKIHTQHRRQHETDLRAVEGRQADPLHAALEAWVRQQPGHRPAAHLVLAEAAEEHEPHRPARPLADRDRVHEMGECLGETAAGPVQVLDRDHVGDDVGEADEESRELLPQAPAFAVWIGERRRGEDSSLPSQRGMDLREVGAEILQEARGPGCLRQPGEVGDDRSEGSEVGKAALVTGTLAVAHSRQLRVVADLAQEGGLPGAALAVHEDEGPASMAPGPFGDGLVEAREVGVPTDEPAGKNVALPRLPGLQLVGEVPLAVDVRDHVVCRSVAVGGLLGAEALDDRAQPVGDPRAVRRLEGDGLERVEAEHLQHVGRVEGRTPAQERVGGDAEGIEVDAVVEGGVRPRQLGSHVLGCAAVAELARRVPGARQTEVEQLDPSVAIDHQVGGLDVEVDQLACVQVGQGPTDLDQVVDDRGPGGALAGLKGVLPLDVLHREDEVARALDRLEVVGRGHVRVPQAGHGVELGLEPVEPSRSQGDAANGLEGDLAVRMERVGDTEHLSHAPAADELLHTIPAVEDDARLELEGRAGGAQGQGGALARVSAGPGTHERFRSGLLRVGTRHGLLSPGPRGAGGHGLAASRARDPTLDTRSILAAPPGCHPKWEGAMDTWAPSKPCLEGV
jgi:hypothetical protein